MKSYTDLFPLVISEINKRAGREVITTDYRYAVQPGGEGGSLDSRALAEIISTIMQDLGEIIEARIISGLDVTAQTPASASIDITAGTATSRGKKWTLEDDTTLKIPLDNYTYVYFVTIYDNVLEISRTYDDTRCQVCKIVVPKPGTSSRIVDDKPNDGYDAYIVSAKDIVFKESQEFDDASVEKLRDVIGDILADNLIGNLKLSENMKIINTSGTLELNSQEVKFSDLSANVLANFKPDGLFFYNSSGAELSKFTTDTARIGNILILHDRLQSTNFVEGISGFRIKSSGDVEFDDAIFRGTIHASTGTIGGFTITSTKLYGGIIQTDLNVGVGANGVVIDSAGLRVYDDVLGLVVNLPSDGSAPTFSSGTINSTVFEINTNAVLRTSETVGDGSASSAGILINNTGLYGCEASQVLASANLKALIDGSIRLKGEIIASAGEIGSVTITATSLSGGLIEGAMIRSSIIETQATTPKVRMDASGFYYQTTASVGKYGTFKYGDGTKYGSGVIAYFCNPNFPPFAVMGEQTMADLRLYNRAADPISGTHAVGDLIVVSGKLKICTVAGSPGTFTVVGTQT